VSWSVSVAPVPRGEFESAVDAAAEDWSNMNQHAEAEAKEQVDKAVELVKALADAVSDTVDRKIGATLSGHANPGHEPRDGYADDSITVNVYQRN